MFTFECPTHAARVLIFPSGIDRTVNTERGIEVHFHCTCGERGIWLTGRGVHAEPVAISQLRAPALLA